VVQAVNSSIRFTDRSGTSLATDVPLSSFFATGGRPVADPRVIYDSLHGRWIATAFTWDCDSGDPGGALFGHGYLTVRISNSANPLASWSGFNIIYPDSMPDYPAPGTSTDKTAFTANAFEMTGGPDCLSGLNYLGVDVFVLDWAAILNISTLPYDYYFTDASYFTARAAVQTPATSAPIRMVIQKYLGVPGSLNVSYASISGLVGAGGGTSLAEYDLTTDNIIQDFRDPIAPRTPGGTIANAVDSRPTDAIWQNNELTFVSTQACTPTGDSALRDCVRVSQLNTGTPEPSLVQDFLVATVGRDNYMGGIGVSGNSGLFAVWTASSATVSDFPSSYASYQLPTDPANSISPAELLAAGEADYAGDRWGDYVGVAQDPQDPNAVWQGNQYASSDGSWETLVSQLKVGAGSTYVPIAPVRVLDTRPASQVGPFNTPFSSDVARTFQIAGVAGIPAGAVAVTGNLTVTQQTALGYVALTVAPTATPPSSTLNFPVGDNRANNVTISLSGSGTLSAVYKAAAGKTVHLILDVTGYFLGDDSGGTYTPLTPARILDSRATSQVGPYSTPFAANVQREFPVWNHGGVPSTAVAVTGNLTVTQQTALGYLAVNNVNTSTPSTSTLNFPLGDNRANGVTVALTGTGSLWAVYKAPAGQTAHVIFDVTGYYEPGTAGLRFYPLNPGRILDSRINLGLSGAFAANLAESLDVDGHLGVPVGADAITGNLTVTQQTHLGFVAMTPTLNNNPSTSTLNFPVGDNRANGVTVPLSGSGNTALVYKAFSGTIHLILDITGYFD
jgi:hypothetical protein